MSNRIWGKLRMTLVQTPFCSTVTSRPFCSRRRILCSTHRWGSLEDAEDTPQKKKRRKNAAGPAAAEEEADGFKTPAPSRAGAKARLRVSSHLFSVWLSAHTCSRSLTVLSAP